MKFVLTSGVSFHAIRNPHFQQAFSNLNSIYKLISGSTNTESAHRNVVRRLNGTTRIIKFHHPAHSAAMLLHPHNWDENYPEKYGPAEFAKIRADLVQIIYQVSQWTMAPPRIPWRNFKFLIMVRTHTLKQTLKMWMQKLEFLVCYEYEMHIGL